MTQTCGAKVSSWSPRSELPKLIAVDLLIVDDFCLGGMDAPESRNDAHDILRERHRSGSTIITSSRGPDERLATSAGPVRPQGAIERFTSNSSDLVIDGESCRKRQQPKLEGARPQRKEAAR